MANKVYPAGNIIFEGGKNIVETLDVVVKGMVRASNDYCTIDLPVGSIIGIGENPGAMYTLTYEAAEEATIFSYPFESEASLVALFKANPKLLGTLVAGCVRFARNLQVATLDTMELARSEFSRIKAAQSDYPIAAISAGVKTKEFPELNSIMPPAMLDPTRGWHKDFIEELFTYETKFKKDFFPLPSIGLGIGLTVNSYALETRDFLSSIFDYLDNLKRTTREFMMSYSSMKSKAASGGEVLFSDEGIDDNSVRNCLDAISDFAMLEPEIFERFSKNLNSFIKNTDRYGSGDAIRKLRRDLATDFYEIYSTCFIQSIGKSWDSIPLGVRMFFMFGFVDEKLAGEENTSKLISIAASYTPDMESRILTVYEWLIAIYKGKVMPSKNEFDMDYPTYLKDLKRNGEIKDADEKKLLESKIDKLKFEIKNLFSTGNRMTFGRITTFVPMFDGDNVTKALEHAYLDSGKINAQLDHIRSIDYKAFCRQTVYSNPGIGVNSLYLDEEVLPYIILMPNVGSRAALWQEIDGKKRNTPARMIISIFHTENLDDTFTKLVAEFRWEMCKTEQGVHWNDVTDPSLTANYCDFLQFYRKNSSLSAEAKEKISTALKNNSNSFKKVFVADYFTYLKYESQGSPRLNKNTREILFTFCPFAKEIRDRIGDNPLFGSYIQAHNVRVAQKLKPLQNIITKLENSGTKIPPEIQRQYEVLTS